MVGNFCAPCSGPVRNNANVALHCRRGRIDRVRWKATRHRRLTVACPVAWTPAINGRANRLTVSLHIASNSLQKPPGLDTKEFDSVRRGCLKLLIDGASVLMVAVAKVVWNWLQVTLFEVVSPMDVDRFSGRSKIIMGISSISLMQEGYRESLTNDNIFVGQNIVCFTSCRVSWEVEKDLLKKWYLKNGNLMKWR